MLPADEFFSPSSVNRKSSQSFLYIDLLFFLPIKLKLYVCVYIYIYIYISCNFTELLLEAWRIIVRGRRGTRWKLLYSKTFPHLEMHTKSISISGNRI